MTAHDEIQHDIPAYVASRLEGEPLRRLESHIAGCLICSEMVGGWKEIASALVEGGEAMFDLHPDVLELRDHAMGKSLGGGLARHVASCATCELEVSAWMSATPASRPVARLAGLGGRAALKGLAAGLALGLALSVAVWWFLPTQEAGGGASQLPLGPPANAGWVVFHVLPKPVRGEPAAPTIRIAPGDTLLYLAVQAEVQEEIRGDEPYRFEVRHQDGQIAWSSELEASTIRQRMASSAALLLAIPTPGLRSGRYELIYGHRGDAGGQGWRRFAFEIVRAD